MDATNFGTAVHILEDFEEEDIWHSIKDSPERMRKEEETNKVANCLMLANMKQEGRFSLTVISCPKEPQGLRMG